MTDDAAVVDVSEPGALRTKHDFFLDEVISALQKTIRRGQEEDAMFWALELDESGYANYAFKRLSIISCEDVGPADPQAIVVVNSCWTAWERIKKAGGSGAYVDPNLLGMAVLYLARAPKNRTVDDLRCHLAGKAQAGLRAEIPDHALDMHCRRGRALGRGLAHFYEYGAVLENEAGDSPYKNSPFIDRGTGDRDDTGPP
jgi:replication-associated recombination protein RarA